MPALQQNGLRVQANIIYFLKLFSNELFSKKFKIAVNMEFIL